MKSVNRFLLVIFLLFQVNITQSQELSKEQMQGDLLFLQDCIHQYFYPLSLVEQRTGVNMDNEFKKLSHQIRPTTSKEEFVQIVRQGLNMLNDGHSQIIPNFILKNYISPDYYLSSIGNVSLADSTNADYYYRLVMDSIQPKIKTGIRTKYMNGKYYNMRSFNYNGNLIRAGETITAINGLPMNQFIKDNYLKMYNLYWDPLFSNYYSGLFTMALPLLGIEKYTLSIGEHDVELDLDKTVDIQQREYPQSNYGNMMVIDDNILYIRMPFMSDGEWYINELLKMYTSKITKIIIDVRGNGGGSDGVWIDLLRKIIDKPLKYKYHVGINHNEAIEKAIFSSFPDLKMIRNEDKTEIMKETIELPDSNSVHFKGKIYVFQDEFSYSAATALSSVAWQNENIELVGAPSALIGGYTLPAIAFKLPNSGIVFTLAISADLVGGTQNPYMDKVEKEILEDDIHIFVDKYLNYDYYSEEYLLNKDKLIKYVREDL